MSLKGIIALVTAAVVSTGIFGGRNAYCIEAASAESFFVRAHADSTYVSESADTVRTPLLAVTTNLFFEYAAAFTGYNTVPANIGVEVPIGKHWSAYADYMITAPWHAWNSNATCVEVMHMAIGGRWYPGGSFLNPFTPTAANEARPLGGWYAFGSVGVGYYDLEFTGKGYQGEEILGSLGIGYGILLGKHLSLNLGIGFGPLYTRYRYYEGRSNNEHLMFQYRGTWRYFGITDAKIALTWLFYHKKDKR